MLLVIGGVHQEEKRNFEDFSDLAGFRVQIERRLHHRHYWRHAKTGSGAVLGQIAKDLDVAGGQADFFARFTQGGFRRRGVLWLESPARKADLPRMIAQMRSALGEQYRRPARAQHNGKEYRSGRQFFVADALLDDENAARRKRLQHRAQAVKINPRRTT